MIIISGAPQGHSGSRWCGGREGGGLVTIANAEERDVRPNPTIATVNYLTHVSRTVKEGLRHPSIPRDFHKCQFID
jgi:hypothetical protein